MKWTTMMLAGALAFGSCASVIAIERSTWAPNVASAAPHPAPLSRLEREALAYFGSVKPYVRSASGELLPPANAAHALRIKVSAYQARLVREEEQRDPTFRLKAELALEQSQPGWISVTWDDESGSRELVFLAQDTHDCGLADPAGTQLRVDTLPNHRCLLQDAAPWPQDGQLTVRLDAVTAQDNNWPELLRDTMKVMAVQAHLARPAQGAI